MSVSLNLFIAILSGSITAFLGILVLIHDRKSITNIIFGILAMVFAVWAGINYASVETLNHGALLWIRAVLVAAVAQVFLLLLFVQNFPSLKLDIKKRNLVFTLLLMVLTMGLAASPFVFQDVKVSDQVVPIIGPLIPVFVCILAFFTFFTFFLITRKYRHSIGQVKEQWSAISFGFISAFGLLIILVLFQVVFFQNTAFVKYAPLFILPIFVGSAYAILKHNLFNIKVITSELITFFLLVVSFVGILISSSTLGKVLGSFATFFTLIFGVLLIRSVLKEVKQREQLEILSKQLGEANEQLKLLDKARAEFISIASHQLRTPPATIKWYVAAVLAGDFGPLSPELKASIERVQVTNDAQIHTIDDLLNASRIERGKLEFFFEKGDLQAVTQSITEQLTPLAQMKKLALIYHKPTYAIPEILLDKEKIRQVINNFIDNAIKYSKTGTISVELKQEKENLVVKVTDNGKGIKPEEAPHLFEKYARGHDSVTHATGLGLGLYVAKVIVEQHQGKIWAESPGEGKGSSFLFSLPIHSDLKPTTVDLTKTQLE
jgi:signal transduction histidine kinase